MGPPPAGCLLRGPLGQIGISRGNLLHTDPDFARRTPDLSNDGGDQIDQRVYAAGQGEQFAGLVSHIDSASQIPASSGVDAAFSLRHSAAQVLSKPDLLGDIRGVFHDLQRFTGAIENRIVTGLQPHLPPPEGYSSIAARIIFAAAELVPEGAIFSATAF